MSIVPFVRTAATVVAAGTALTAGFSSVRAAPRPHVAAQAFLDTLTTEQRQSAVFPFGSDEQSKWKFVPGDDRKGVALWDLGADQQAAALDLLSTCLSPLGYQRVQTIRELETVLLQIENADPKYRHPRKYYFTVFGTPSASGSWGLRFEGHHQSLHWSFKGDRIVASTPQFFGTNPAKVPAGLPLAGTELLRSEQDLGRALAVSLDPSQQAKAIVNTVAPPDILTGDRRRVEALEDLGIGYSELNPAQRKALESIVDTHAASMPSAEAKRRKDAIRRSGWNKVKFAWMGSLEPGKGHYYRVQGPSFVIEYDNTQNNANHVHDVWRDFQGDFGRSSGVANGYGEDILARHYAQDHRP